MVLSIVPAQIAGFPISEVNKMQELLNVFNYHNSKNIEKNKYYEGNISLNSVNLGLALPDGISKLEIGCSWGSKTVDVLASRSIFDGFVGVNGNDVDALDKLCLDNNLIAEYAKACRDELKYGCTFATLSADDKIGCKIRFHSPQTAAALWDGEKGRISCGFAIIDTVPDDSKQETWSPSLIYYYNEDAVYELIRENDLWRSVEHRHIMGRPLMEALIWNATSNKPFGRSRIKEPIRRLIDGYVRTIANATIGLEFSTAPQKYLLGVTDEQYDVVINQKFKQYVGSMIAASTNPETGEKPTFGQLAQGSISPHVEMIRILATQFSAATGLTVTDTGVVSEANPSSADAVLAQTQTLVSMAEQLNITNGDTLRVIALMATAIINKKAYSDLNEDEVDIVAHFRNPAMPSVAMTADAAIKIASAREYFADTDTFLEMIGFDKADIRRIKAQERRERGMALVDEMSEEEALEDTEEEEELQLDLSALEAEKVEEGEGTASDVDEVVDLLESLLEELG